MKNEESSQSIGTIFSQGIGTLYSTVALVCIAYLWINFDIGMKYLDFQHIFASFIPKYNATKIQIIIDTNMKLILSVDILDII